MFFFMVNENIEFLAFGIVTYARPEVTLLSEELLCTRIASSTLSSLRLLCTLDIAHADRYSRKSHDVGGCNLLGLGEKTASL